MKKLKLKAERAATNNRLRTKSLARTRCGYVTPGCDPKEIEEASKLNALMKKDKSIKAPPDPKIVLSPLTQEGAVNVKFSEPMLSPQNDTIL